MKFLHLSDLHIGKTVHNFSMIDDQIYILDQILQYISEYNPEAVVIAGDVYDKPTPSTEAVRVFDSFLTSVAAQKVALFIINGNHDSPERIAFASEIMGNQNIYLYGVFNGQSKIFSLEDQFGTVCFHLLPFIKPSIANPFYNHEIECSHDAVKKVIESSNFNADCRNVLVAHQFAVSLGCAPECCESEIGPVGGIDSVDVSILSQFDYVALGHLHGAQRIGSDHIRYAGSPLKYSFSEYLHKKSVTLVEMGAKGCVEVTLLPLTPQRDMRKLKGPLDQLISDAVVSQGNSDDYIYATLTDENEIPDAIGKIRNTYPNVMGLCFDNARTRAQSDLSGISTTHQTLTPLEQFEIFFRMQNRQDMNEQQSAIVEQLLKKIGGEV